MGMRTERGRSLGVDIEEMLKAVSNVKGVGPALAGKIRTAVNELFRESGVKENEIEM